MISHRQFSFRVTHRAPVVAVFFLCWAGLTPPSQAAPSHAAHYIRQHHPSVVHGYQREFDPAHVAATTSSVAMALFDYNVKMVRANLDLFSKSGLFLLRETGFGLRGNTNAKTHSPSAKIAKPQRKKKASPRATQQTRAEKQHAQKTGSLLAAISSVVSPGRFEKRSPKEIARTHMTWRWAVEHLLTPKEVSGLAESLTQIKNKELFDDEPAAVAKLASELESATPTKECLLKPTGKHVEQRQFATVVDFLRGSNNFGNYFTSWKTDPKHGAFPKLDAIGTAKWLHEPFLRFLHHQPKLARKLTALLSRIDPVQVSAPHWSTVLNKESTPEAANAAFAECSESKIPGTNVTFGQYAKTLKQAYDHMSSFVHDSDIGVMSDKHDTFLIGIAP